MIEQSCVIGSGAMARGQVGETFQCPDEGDGGLPCPVQSLHVGLSIQGVVHDD